MRKSSIICKNSCSVIHFHSYNVRFYLLVLHLHTLCPFFCQFQCNIKGCGSIRLVSGGHSETWLLHYYTFPHRLSMAASPSALLLSSSKSWRGGCRRADRARDMEHCVKCCTFEWHRLVLILLALVSKTSLRAKISYNK